MFLALGAVAFGRLVPRHVSSWHDGDLTDARSIVSSQP
jgi:hypothetical protein